MLATLVIGLREGLEASLIVGIIAAFLRRNGKSLRPMWIGVSVAILLSIGVGVVLEIISSDLPQAQQEGMESVIGLIAVVVVTGMIGWMNRHARNMRSELERSAERAMHDGTAWALVGMAFLAVLKEGFETSVFLLAAFQSSTSALTAGAGALIGVLVAVGIGIGIFQGGIKLNLSRFFRITGVFLVFVAAGLVLSALRTAHEAGWILIGQQNTLNLSWLAPNGSVQAALITGVLGIPADPRLIEVLGWCCYLVPALLYLLWPVSKRPAAAAVPKLQWRVAAGLVVAAVVVAIAIPLPGAYHSDAAALSGGGTATLSSSAELVIAKNGSTITVALPGSGTKTQHAGIDATLWKRDATSALPSKPTTLSLDDLVSIGGGRLPIGFSASENPGPFTAAWKSTTSLSVWTSVQGGSLLDATSQATTVLTLSGGGLPSSRTLSVPAADAADTGNWTITPGHAAKVASTIASTARSASELLLWKLYLPIVLILAAIIVGASALLNARRLRRETSPDSPTPARSLLGRRTKQSKEYQPWQA